MASDDREKQLDALTDAISRVITPVMICMLLSIGLVNSLGDSKCGDVERASSPPTPLPWELDQIPPTTQPEVARGNLAATFNNRDAFIFVGIFCVLIVVMTFFLVWLFRRGHTRFIAIWLFCAVAIIFAYVGGIYLFEFARTQCINLDWVSLSFAVWNFTVVGLVSVFWTVPRLINQAYLIVMSALMAYIFRTLPAWATWVILAVLVVWDLFAVLAPFGPLRKLVETAREREEPLPALVYDTNPNDVGRDAEAHPVVIFKKKRNRAQARRSSEAPEDPEAEQNREARAKRRQRRREAAEQAAQQDVEVPNDPGAHVVSPRQGNAEEAPPDTRRGTQNEQTQQGVGTLGTHLKLGLGDFVFYSVLVAQASSEGAMTAVTSFVAILSGLCATLFLVIVYRKALPALPISIIAGMTFFFLTRYTVQPFVLNLLPELMFH